MIFVCVHRLKQSDMPSVVHMCKRRLQSSVRFAIFWFEGRVSIGNKNRKNAFLHVSWLDLVHRHAKSG